MLDLDFGRVRPKYMHYNLVKKRLVGYFSKDTWVAEDFKLPGIDKTNRKSSFKFENIKSLDIRNEIKFYYCYLLGSKVINTAAHWVIYVKMLIPLTNYLNNELPKISSIVYLGKDQFLAYYYRYLKKIKNDKDINFKGIALTYHMKFVTGYYDYFFDLYDTRDETEKDSWDAKKLGINYNKSRNENILSFTNTPSPYKELLKRYIKLRLISLMNLKCGSCKQCIEKLNVFLKFINEKYPNWRNLNKLDRKDIVKFIEFLNKNYSKHFLILVISFLETFILYIQRYEWKEAPNKNVNMLIFSEDKPKNNRSRDTVRYVPDDVWEQVVTNMDKMKKEYIPLVLVLEASGFRISDICMLKTNCLEKKDDGYWLCGNQQKVNIENHRVPITNEIAEVIKAQCEYIKSKTNALNNPENFLFPVLNGRRKSLPLSQQMVVYHLNKLSKICNIVDKNGEPYIFNNHAFRHRYGVTLINNGMNILHVQKLMAHASPEMTLVYARMFDNTLREEWEKARNKGAIKIDSSGVFVAADIEKQAKENGLELEWIRHNLEAIRLEHGFCIKSIKIKCDYLAQTLEPPCIQNKCRCFHVDESFLSFYNEQIMKMESDIAIYEKTNRTRLVEVIMPKLKWYKDIRDAILNNGGVYGQPKERREYFQDDREKENVNV